MKRGDFIWAGILGCVVAALLYPASHAAIMKATQLHPYLMGFVKFSILASLGELLAIRIVGNEWTFPPGMIYRAFVWGGVGLFVVPIFPVFWNGVAADLKSGLLPGGQSGSLLIRAIWTSAVMNMTFGPVVMIGHRICDTYIDLAGGRLFRLPSVRLEEVVTTINWHNLIEVVCVRMLVFFWLPAHTITFLVPPEYRVLFAAALSFAMGVILAFFKRKHTQVQAASSSTLAIPPELVSKNG